MRWPFPRSLHAKAIDRLRGAGARAIVYDVQFTEQTKPREDLALYDAVARAGRVVLATTEIGDGGATNVLGGDENLRNARAWAAAANLPTSPGGVIRRVRESIGGLDTIAVRTAENSRGAVRIRPCSRERRPDRLPRPARHDPGRLVLRSREGPGRPGLIRGRVVVVGASAPSLQDVHATPTATHTSMSGPEIQANAIWTAMHGFPLRDGPPWAGLLALAVLAFAAPARRPAPRPGWRPDRRCCSGRAMRRGPSSRSTGGRSCRSSRPSRRARSGSWAASRRATGWRAGSGGG